MENDFKELYALGSTIDMVLVLMVLMWYSVKNIIIESKDKLFMVITTLIFILLSWVGVFVILIMCGITLFVTFYNKFYGVSCD